MKISLRRGVVRSSAAVALATVLALFGVLPSQADVTPQLDAHQDFWGPAVSHAAGGVAQTFKAGLTGDIDHISLVTSYVSPNITTITVEIHDTDPSSGAPIGSPLGTSAAQPLTSTPAWRDYRFTSTVHVVAGNTYAVVVPMNSTFVSWSYVNGDPYSNGQMWVTFCFACPFVTGPQFGTNYALRDFAFKTYVLANGTPPPPPANHAPTVAAAGNQAGAFEGTAPTMTGTFSDPDPGDTVTLKPPTRGTLTVTTPGHWLWTGTADDEDVPQSPVTITATDSHGATGTATFTVKIDGMAPTPTISLGTGLTAQSAQLLEGRLISLTGSAWSPDASDRAKGFDLSWTVTRDGAVYKSGVGAAFSFTPDDDGIYTVDLDAKDDGNMTGHTSMSLVVDNVKPSAQIVSIVPAIVSPKIVLPGESITFTGSASDPGTADPLTATWDFGDSTPPATGWTANHWYAKSGSYLVTLTVSDGDPEGVGTATKTVIVQTPAQALGPIADYVRGIGSLNNGEKNSLIAKLNAASASLDRGNTDTATNQLNAFLNELDADVKTGKVSAADGTNLRLALEAVLGALGSFNRFLDWWPLAA